MSDEDGPDRKATREVPAFGKDTPESALVRELLASIEGLKKDLREDVRGLHVKIKDNADSSLQAHEITRRQVTRLTSVVRVLWTTVKGSAPPPAVDDQSFSFMTEPTTRKEGQPTIEEHISEHDLTIQAIQGQLIAVSSAANLAKDKIAEVATSLEDAQKAAKDQIDSLAAKLGEETKSSNAHVSEVRTQVETLLSLQKEQMGKRDPDDGRSFLRRLGDAAIWIVKEREGQKFAMTFLAGVTGLVTALAWAYAVATGHAPMMQPYQQAPTSPPALTAPDR